MSLLENPAWRNTIRNINRFSDHAREDPAIWSIIILTGGTMIWGAMMGLRKYWYEPDRK